jgi:hypothetical protein
VRGRLLTLCAGLLAAAALTPALSLAAKKSRAGIAIGDLVWIDREVLRSEPPDKTVWHRVTTGDKLRTGDTLRTGANAVARVELPWMSLTLSPSAMLTVPATAVLSTVLEQGRVEFAGAGRDIVKIMVGESEVRGGGRIVLRRSIGQTSLSVLGGSFRVRALGRTVELKAGEGTLVMDGRAPLPASALPAAPEKLKPGTDPAYVRAGRPVQLRWSAQGASHHVELLGLQGDTVLLARDASAPPLQLEIPWVGTYRWRVSSRDARGIESPPSSDGWICLVDR